MRVFALSDLHVDFAANARVVADLSRRDYVDDALIVAGDIAHDDRRIRWALTALRRCFRQVHYVPGNHELWVRSDHGDSLARCLEVLGQSRDLGVHTGPEWAGSVWVVPLLSWYDSALDGSSRAADLRSWADHQYCRWPPTVKSPARYFSDMNRECPALLPAREAGPCGDLLPPAQIISFSHFVPRADLLPPAPLLRFRGLPAVAGSPLIEEHVRALGAGTHVFGHSHIQRDVTRSGVRYVQNALGYPRERRERCVELKLVSEE